MPEWAASPGICFRSSITWLTWLGSLVVVHLRSCVSRNLSESNPLGKPVEYIQTYTPSLLCTIERALARGEMEMPEPLPFKGEDVWNAYELTWLDGGG